MPIPLAQIPNAPRLAPDPAMTRVPNARTDLSGAARNLMTPQLQQGSFDGAARGAGAIGDSIGRMGAVGARIGAVFSDIQARKIRQQDSVNLAIRNRKVSERFAKFETETRGMSEDEWVPKWNEVMSKFGPEVEGDLKFSDEGLRRLEVDKQQFMAQTNTRLIGAANRSAVERGNGELLGRAQTEFEAGNEDTAATIYADMVVTGAMTQNQVDRRWEGHILTRDKNQRAAMMIDNPVLYASDLKSMRDGDALDEGQVSFMEQHFSGPEGPTRLLQAEGEAARYARGIQVDKSNEILNKIIEGDVTTEDEVREQGEGLMDSITIDRLVTVLESDPQYDSEKVSTLRTEIATYLAKDDRDLSGYASLQQRIGTEVPKGLQGPLNSELYTSYSRNRDGKSSPQTTRLKGEAFQFIDKLANSGVYGDTGLGTKGETKGKVVDAEQSAKAWGQVESVKEDMAQWFSDNPNATAKEASEKLNGMTDEVIRQKAADEAAKIRAGGDWTDWIPTRYPGGFGLGTTYGYPSEPEPDIPKVDVIKAADEMDAMDGDTSASSQPASIRSNNPGAMYAGSSSKKFGATREDTIGGGHKIAVFPDAESGAAAQFDLLDRGYTGMTVASAIKKWSGGNHVESYLSVIEKSTGLTSDTKLTKEMLRDPEIAIPLAKAMARHEAGKDFPLDEDGWNTAHQRAFQS